MKYKRHSTELPLNVKQACEDKSVLDGVQKATNCFPRDVISSTDPSFHFLRIYITDAFTGIRFPTTAQFHLFAAASALCLGKPYRVENDFLQI